MPQNITDVSTFTDPVTAPADGDALDAASIITNGIQAAANRTRYLVDRVGGAAGTGEFGYADSPRARVRTLSPFMMTEGALGAGTQFWTVANFASGGTSRARTSQLDRAILVDDVARYLPIGASLTGVEVMVAPGIARATVGDRITVTLTRHTPDWVTTPSPIPAAVDVFTATDDGLLPAQVIASGAIAENISRSVNHVLRIVAGVDAGTNKDDVFAIRLSFTVPGPNAF